jgi:hypothetical protein
MTDRFDFEQQIMECWRVTDDIGVVAESILERNITQDQITNILCGIQELYQLKFNKLFDQFDEVVIEPIKHTRMLEEECAALRAQLATEILQKGKKK